MFGLVEKFENLIRSYTINYLKYRKHFFYKHLKTKL